MFDSSHFTYRSFQLYHLQLVGGECVLEAPSAELCCAIDYYWFLTISAPCLNLEIIPDVAVDMVLSPDIENFAELYFPQKEKYSLELDGPIRYVGISFKAEEVHRLLGFSLSQLKAICDAKSLPETLELSSLLSELEHLNSLPEISQRFNTFWQPRLDSVELKVATRHDRVLDALHQSVGQAKIHTVCQSLSISERQFRRLSDDIFGLSPKALQRVLRLQDALAELLNHKTAEGRDLYYDDSHRIREIKQLTGLTPSEIRKMAEIYNSE